jgi:cytochrome c oxidase subunit III
MSAESYLAEQFESELQQREAAQLGMWVFLGTEVMLFSGIFAGILIYRLTYWQALQTATHHLHVGLGSANTALLLTSSLTMGFGVLAAREGQARRTFWYLIATALLGVAFLGIKGYEYLEEYREGLMPGVGPPFPLDVPPAKLFYHIYFAGTGLHAFHLTCGVGAILIFAWLVRTRRFALPARQMMIEGLGMYWGLVDLIWVFLFSSLYLI